MLQQSECATKCDDASLIVSCSPLGLPVFLTLSTLSKCLFLRTRQHAAMALPFVGDDRDREDVLNEWLNEPWQRIQQSQQRILNPTTSRSEPHCAGAGAGRRLPPMPPGAAMKADGSHAHAGAAAASSNSTALRSVQARPPSAHAHTRCAFPSLC